jgi:hypothetical protein
MDTQEQNRGNPVNPVNLVNGYSPPSAIPPLDSAEARDDCLDYLVQQVEAGLDSREAIRLYREFCRRHPLRRMMKADRRSYGLRCVAIRPAKTVDLLTEQLDNR